MLVSSYNANSLALYTLVLSSRHFAAGNGSAKLELIEISFIIIQRIFYSPINTSSSAKRQRKGPRAVGRGGRGQYPHRESLLTPPPANFRNLLRFRINSKLLLCFNVKTDEIGFSHWHVSLYNVIAILTSKAFPSGQLSNLLISIFIGVHVRNDRTTIFFGPPGQ